MWGFITCMNDILIPYLKKIFELDRFQPMLVQFAFFGAYFIGSVLYFIVSINYGDPIQKITYKKGLITGLIISATGCTLFYPAAHFKIFGFFLAALFILGLGLTILQIAANPYIAILGKPESASGRLNLSQGFNSFGTTIAPIIGGYMVFDFFARMGRPLLNEMGEAVLTDQGNVMSAVGLQLPYLIFAAVFLLLAVIIWLTDLPVYTSGEEIPNNAGALKFRHLKLGMIAKFLPHRSLMVFALLIIVLLVTTLLSGGRIAMWTVIAVGLFNSIMWSNIFTLAIKDLGKYTSQGSSLLVMMILGGALIPLAQGAVAKLFASYHISFIVPLIAYIYLAYYGWKGFKVIMPKNFSNSP